MIVAAAVVAILAEAAAFAPPVGVPVTYVVSETRDEGTGPIRYAITRRATFAPRAGGGFIASVETLAIEGEGDGGRRFARSAAPFKGRTIVISLDAAGRIVDVANHAGVWDAIVAAVATNQTTRAPKASPARAAATSALIARLRATPPARQIALIGDALDPLLGVDALRAGPYARRAITQPVQRHDGAGATLTGSEQAVRTDRALTVERDVAGTMGEAAMRNRSTLEVETRTGLVTARRETIETSIGGRTLTMIRVTERR